MRISDWSSAVCSSDLDDRLFAYTYEPEDFRRVVSCCGDQEGVGPGWDDYTLDVGCGQVLLRFDHGSCRVDDHSRTAGSSEERRVGQEWVSTCRSRWSQYH